MPRDVGPSRSVPKEDVPEKGGKKGLDEEDDLRHKHAINREKRLEKIREKIDTRATGFISFLAALYAMLILVFFFHIIAPPWLEWLEDDQLSDIKSIFFSSAIGALVSRYMHDVFHRRS